MLLSINVWKIAGLVASLLIIAGVTALAWGFWAYKRYTVPASTVLAEPTGEQRIAVELPPGVDSLDEMLEPLRVHHQRPALAAAVVRGDGLVAVGAVGARKAGAPSRVTIDDRFHLGSCTKAMTATVVAGLVEDGKLMWESSLATVFPRLVDDIYPSYRQVTLEQLLHHRSGLPDDRQPDRKIFPKVRQLSGDLRDQRLELMRLVLEDKPSEAPGTTFQYSNYGYVIAAAMAEQVTSKSWEELMEARLFAPLGMASAGFGAPGQVDAIDEPWGHRRVFKSFLPVAPGPGADNPAVLGPAGTVHSAIADFAAFAALHLRGARGQGELLASTTFERLHEDRHGQGYAAGWGVVEREWAGGKALTHVGSNTFFMAMVWIAPERDLAFVVATNAGDEDSFEACDAVVSRLVQRYLGS